MKKKSIRQRAVKPPVVTTTFHESAQRVIPARAKRQSREPSREPSPEVDRQNRPAPIDRELLRAALAASLKIPKSQVTAAILNKHLRQIAAEARESAELVAAYHNELMLQRTRLGCTTQDAIEHYRAAEEQVLLELYAELGRPLPSPTKLLQLSVQYALDARKRIDAPAHQIDVRHDKASCEVALIPRGQLKIRSLPNPGQVIGNPFAIHLLRLVKQQPPAHSDILQLIEALLERVPARANGAVQPKIPVPLIEVNLEESIVIVAGRPYPVGYEGAVWVSLLNSEPNLWFGPKDYGPHEILKSVRVDRVYKALPRPLKSLIESKTGAGYRLSKAHLAELRQKSSVVTPSKAADNIGNGA